MLCCCAALTASAYAQQVAKFDDISSNEVPQSITNIQRLNGVVTANLGGNLPLTAGKGFALIDVTISTGDTSFAGTFVVLTVSGTTLTWNQSGPDTGVLTPTGTVSARGWGLCLGGTGPSPESCAGGNAPSSTAQTFGSSPALDGGSMLLSETESGLNNGMSTDTAWFYNAGVNDTATNFTLDLQFNVQSNTNIQSLEFDQFQYLKASSNQVLVDTKLFFGTQCITGHNWQVWDVYQAQSRPDGDGWVDTLKPCSYSVSQTGFNHLTISVHRIPGDTACGGPLPDGTTFSGPCMYYDSITLNGTVVVSGFKTSSGRLTGAEQTGFQLQIDSTANCLTNCTISESIDEGAFWESTPPLTSFVLPDSSSHTVFKDVNSHLIDLFLNSSDIWQKQDLMTAPGAVLPSSASSLANIVNAGGCPHVFYVTQDDHFGSLYLSNISGGCASTWSYQDLTTASGATNLVAGNSSIATVGASNDALQEQFYIGSDFHLYRLYWPSSGGVFNQDLTSASGAGQVNSGSGLAAIVNAGNCPHVFYVDTNQHVSDIYQANIPGGGCTTTWTVEDLTSLSGAGNLARSNSPISTLGASNDALQQQYYVGNDNHLYRFYWPTSGGVFNQDLTPTGVVPVEAGSGLASIINAGGCPHAFYIDVNQHVSSVFLGNISGGCAATWSYQDLTSASGATNLAFATSPVTTLGPTIDALQSQFYIGANNDVFRLSWPSSGGVVNLDITAAAQ
jgi:hypothetical protein